MSFPQEMLLRWLDASWGDMDLFFMAHSYSSSMMANRVFGLVKLNDFS
ncbi:hypothetical protein [Parapedobacter koreensis]|nr:hypothetical protein [Parapedobacter koreensis]